MHLIIQGRSFQGTALQIVREMHEADFGAHASLESFITTLASRLSLNLAKPTPEALLSAMVEHKFAEHARRCAVCGRFGCFPVSHDATGEKK